jgi:ATP-dependent Clp protease adaptor protein ClpS
MDNFPDSAVKTRPKHETKKELKEPEEHKVVLLNDNYTTMDFVVAVIIEVFHKSELEATAIMLDIHKKGRGIAGTYPLDIAQTKTAQVMQMAAEYNFPLKAVVE